MTETTETAYNDETTDRKQADVGVTFTQAFLRGSRFITKSAYKAPKDACVGG